MGVTLHFQLLRYLTLFFVVATVVTLPVILASFAGGRLATVPMAINLDSLRVSKLSIANIGLPRTDLNGTLIESAALRPWGLMHSSSYTHRVVSIIVSACDLLMIILFFFFSLFLQRRIARVTREIQANSLNASDYAVYVTGLPPHATEDEARHLKLSCHCEILYHPLFDCRSWSIIYNSVVFLFAPRLLTLQIRDHFSKLYNLQAPDWTFKSSCGRCCWTGRKMWQRRQFRAPVAPGEVPLVPVWSGGGIRDEDVYPVLDASNSSNPAYLMSWVAEVSVATANGGLILRYQASPYCYC